MKVGIVTTGSEVYHGRITDKFTPVVKAKLEEAGYTVRMHATTRSPIAVSKEEKYPLHTRYELASLYDKNRTTFVYDLTEYEEVLVLTDAQKQETEGWESLQRALTLNHNRQIRGIRWC